MAASTMPFTWLPGVSRATRLGIEGEDCREYYRPCRFCGRRTWDGECRSATGSGGGGGITAVDAATTALASGR